MFRAGFATHALRGGHIEAVHSLAHRPNDELSAQWSPSSRPMKKLKVLCLTHEDLVPPTDLVNSESFHDEEWRTEQYIFATLNKLGHEVRMLGTSLYKAFWVCEARNKADNLTCFRTFELSGYKCLVGVLSWCCG